MTPRLQVSGLWSRRGSETVLRNVELEVAPGELVLVSGANGCGKSTLLESIAGVVRPSAGEVRLDGARIDGLSPDELARRGVSLVHQERRLFSSLTVQENVALADFAGGRRNPLEPVAAVLERFGVARLANTAAGLLSGGEQRLVALARSLRSNPSVVLLDEPLAALAADVRDRILDELSVSTRRGTALVVVEHDRERVQRVAHRELVLRLGGLVSVDPVMRAIP